MTVEQYKCFAGAKPVIGSCCKIQPSQRILVAKQFPHYGYGEYLSHVGDRLGSDIFYRRAYTNRYLGLSGTVQNWDAAGTVKSGSVVVNRWTGEATLTGDWWRGYDPNVIVGGSRDEPINETYISSTATTASWKRTWRISGTDITWAEQIYDLWLWSDFLPQAYQRYLNIPWSEGASSSVPSPFNDGVSCVTRLAVGWTPIGLLTWIYTQTQSGYLPSMYDSQKMQVLALDSRIFSASEYLDQVLQSCNEYYCYPSPCDFIVSTPVPIPFSLPEQSRWWNNTAHTQILQIRDEPCPP